MKTHIYCLSYLAQFFFEWKIVQENFVEKIKTHFCVPYFLSENRVVYEVICKKYSRAGDNMLHAHSMLDI